MLASIVIEYDLHDICRDNEALRQWRGETKQLQNDKYREAHIYGGAKGNVLFNCKLAEQNI